MSKHNHTQEQMKVHNTLKKVLATHREIKQEKLEKALDFLCSKIRKLDRNSLQFLVFANKDGIGRLAFTFNHELDLAIADGDMLLLHHLLMGPKDMFIEIYHNKYLNEHQKESLILTLKIAAVAMKKSVENDGTSNKCDYTHKISEDDKFQVKNKNLLESHSTFQRNCYKDVELSFQLESEEKSEIPKKSHYKGDLVDTIKALYRSKDNFNVEHPTNFKLKMHPMVAFILKDRLEKEIAMYARYQEILCSKVK